MGGESKIRWHKREMYLLFPVLIISWIILYGFANAVIFPISLLLNKISDLTNDSHALIYVSGPREIAVTFFISFYLATQLASQNILPKPTMMFTILPGILVATLLFTARAGQYFQTATVVLTLSVIAAVIGSAAGVRRGGLHQSKFVHNQDLHNLDMITSTKKQNLSRRFLSCSINIFLLATLYILTRVVSSILILIFNIDVDLANVHVFGAVNMFVFLVLFYWLFIRPIRMSGSNIGRKIIGIRTERADGAKLSTLQYIVLDVAAIPSVLLGLIFVPSFIDSGGQTLYEKAFCVRTIFTRNR